MGALLFIVSVILSSVAVAVSSPNGGSEFLENCSSNVDFAAELLLFEKCTRSTVTNPFKIGNGSLPFNKYAFLTTHNSYAIGSGPFLQGVRLTFINQEDSITEQLTNGVRALMLDTYDYKGEVWMCHSFKGECHDYTAFKPAINYLNEVQAFLSSNPSEIVTLILEDYVKTPNGLTKLFNDAGLMKYWFPVSRMPNNGGDWPLVNDMIAQNQRLVVFGSMEEKEKSEGIAYQWNYMVENKYGNGGMVKGKCSQRKESSPLNDKTKSLVLVNHFKTIPLKAFTAKDNSEKLIDMLSTCYDAAGNRWANFVAVNFYKRCQGGGAFEATDKLNGRLMCGSDDLLACAKKDQNAKNKKEALSI
ncbi:unnamed protein product [Lupinus luteus]|uniref:Uncharacterized protein n=1 Tax=Lupinus luteus TaxID=3873 RepID=A0AAV1X2L7_LUPLU